MNPVGPEPRPWPRSRWYLLTLLVFATQIGLIFAFGDHKPPDPRHATFVPQLQLPGVPNEWLAMSDPTLFALPSVHGFSAPAWLEAPPVQPPAFEWSETNIWLFPPLGNLGSALLSLVETNQSVGFAFEATEPPRWSDTTNGAPGPLPPAQTTLRVEGELAQRQLLSQPELPPIPLADLLQPSTVQIFVDDAGHVVTTALLPPKSGSDDADQQALSLARQVHFAPLPFDKDAAPQWTPGTLIFQWVTIPTNTAPAAP